MREHLRQRQERAQGWKHRSDACPGPGCTEAACIAAAAQRAAWSRDADRIAVTMSRFVDEKEQK